MLKSKLRKTMNNRSELGNNLIKSIALEDQIGIICLFTR